MVSWIGNFAGTAIFLGLMLAAGSFEGSKGEFAKVLAGKKVSAGSGLLYAAYTGPKGQARTIIRNAAPHWSWQPALAPLIIL